MDSIHNRNYISVRMCELCEDIKRHTALTEYDEKIVRACIHEMIELINLNVSCYTWFINDGGKADGQ